MLLEKQPERIEVSNNAFSLYSLLPAPSRMARSDEDARSYARRVFVTAGIISFFLLVTYLIVSLIQVLLIVFSGLLLAVFLSGLTDRLSARLPLSRGIVLALVTTALFGGLLGAFALAGPDIAHQVGQLIDRLPGSIQRLREAMQQMLQDVPTIRTLIPAPATILGSVTNIFSSTLGAIVNTLIIMLIGVYGAAEPHVYVNGLVHLVPRARRSRFREVLHAVGRVLRWWLVGRLTSMVIVGLLITGGLWLADVPSATALGLIAAILDFVPYVGPLLAVVPALLVALGGGLTKVGYVVLIYMMVQVLEGYLITPLVQERAVSLPPAMLITAQVVMGVLAGATGVLMATPLAVTVIVLVQMLYIEDVLDDTVKILGEH